MTELRERNWEIFYQRMCGKSYGQIAADFDISAPRAMTITNICGYKYYRKRYNLPLTKRIRKFAMLSSFNGICVMCRLLWYGLDPWYRTTWTEHGKKICGARSPKKYLDFLDTHDAYLHECLSEFANPTTEQPRGVIQKRTVDNTVIYTIGEY